MPYGAYGINSYLYLLPLTERGHIPNRPRDDILTNVVLRDTAREWDRVLLLLP